MHKLIPANRDTELKLHPLYASLLPILHSYAQFNRLAEAQITYKESLLYSLSSGDQCSLLNSMVTMEMPMYNKYTKCQL